MLREGLYIMRDFFGNLVSGAPLSYVVEPRNWVIMQDGRYITENLVELDLLNARVTTTSIGLEKRIVHFGSLSVFRRVDRSNWVVVTCFHIVPDDNRMDELCRSWDRIDIIHTSNDIAKKELIALGAPEERLIKIPLGVDLDIFKPIGEETKMRARERLGIPDDAKVIGSFQKDGSGWGEGLSPKWIKGPDTLVDVLGGLWREYEKDIFVLLLGPARGYVKKNLENRGIPFLQIFVEDYYKIPKYYNMLDLYLVTSRVEGGPQSILESMASGVPVVSTRVGMAPEVIRDGENGMLTDIGDRSELFDKAASIMDSESIASRLIENGLETVKEYSWKKITERYYNEIYSRFIEEEGITPPLIP